MNNESSNKRGMDFFDIADLKVVKGVGTFINNEFGVTL